MNICTTKDFKIDSIKNRIHKILDVPAPNDNMSRLFDIFMMSLIGLNIIILMIQTFKPIYNVAQPFFLWFEIISIIIFTIEYLFRVWSCTVIANYSHSIYGRINFCIKPLMLIDLLAILPFYLPFLGLDLRFIRIFRLFRLFRIFKIARYSKSLRIMGKIIHSKSEELIISLSFLFLLLIIGSFLIYDAESKVQPKVFSSIIQAFELLFATMTNSSFANIVPKTAIGKIITSVTSFLGIILFALPTSILTSGFIEEYYDERRNNQEDSTEKVIIDN